MEGEKMKLKMENEEKKGNPIERRRVESKPQ